MQFVFYLLLVLPCLAWSDDATADRAKRDLRMLRMGKRSLQMLRMGRSVPVVEPESEYSPYDQAREDHGRAPPLPRLGKNLQNLINDEYRRYLDEEALYDITRQLWRNPPPRIGRYARDTDAVQQESQNELPEEGARIARDFPRLGLRETLPRFGLRSDEAALEETDFPRMGLRSSEERALPMPRLGYRETDEEKRAMSMLRMGKRAMSMLRMGKRPVSMLRMGRTPAEDQSQEKRAMSMLRMGKRAMSMLRMGKRAMSMLRMGKKSDTEPEKRAMSMLRMGKRDMAEEEQVKRAMSMLRMGKREEEKRAMSMLRMGKRDLGDDNNMAAASEKKNSA